jgi:hypothetical protein
MTEQKLSRLKRVFVWALTEKGSAAATWLQTFVLFFSLLSIAYQVRQQTSLIGAANAQASVALITPLNLKLTEHEMAKVWLEGSRGFKAAPDNEDEIKKTQYENLLITNLVFYENVYSQHEEGLLDEAIFSGWKEDLKTFISEWHVEQYWDDKRKKKYRPDFGADVDRFISERQQNPAR